MEFLVRNYVLQPQKVNLFPLCHPAVGLVLPFFQAYKEVTRDTKGRATSSLCLHNFSITQRRLKEKLAHSQLLIKV